MAFRAKADFIKKRADFYTDLSEALKDRASLLTEIKKYRALALKKKRVSVAAMFEVWLARLDKGSFTDSIRTTMPISDCMILQSFEASGKLPEGLDFLSDIVTKSNKMKGTMTQAMAVPAILAIFICVMIAMVGLFMVPILEQIYPHEQWPFMGQLLYPISLFMEAYGIYAGLTVILLIFIFSKTIAAWTGPVRNKFDNYLPYSIFRDYHGALFLTSLAALLKGGTGLVDSLVLIRSMSTPWMSWHVSKMLTTLDNKSAQPAKAIDTGVMPEEIAERISAYGERSSFVQAMAKIGLSSMDKTEEKIKKTAKVINTAMLLIAGLALGLIIAGVVLTSLHAETVIRQQMY